MSVIDFKPKTVAAHNAELTGSYQFTERPAAKSSTSVGVGGTVCRTCGGAKGGGTVEQRAERELKHIREKKCTCPCHGELRWRE